MFGSDFAVIFIEENEAYSSYTYEVSRVNLTELNSNHGTCTNELENIPEEPGIVLGEKGPQTVEKCILNYYHDNLKCQVPWSKYWAS